MVNTGWLLKTRVGERTSERAASRNPGWASGAAARLIEREERLGETQRVGGRERKELMLALHPCLGALLDSTFSAEALYGYVNL